MTVESGSEAPGKITGGIAQDGDNEIKQVVF